MWLVFELVMCNGRAPSRKLSIHGRRMSGGALTAYYVVEPLDEGLPMGRHERWAGPDLSSLYMTAVLSTCSMSSYMQG